MHNMHNMHNKQASPIQNPASPAPASPARAIPRLGRHARHRGRCHDCQFTGGPGAPAPVDEQERPPGQANWDGPKEHEQLCGFPLVVPAGITTDER